jgi:hypothetical protein
MRHSYFFSERHQGLLASLSPLAQKEALLHQDEEDFVEVCFVAILQHPL